MEYCSYRNASASCGVVCNKYRRVEAQSPSADSVVLSELEGPKTAHVA